MLCPKCKNEIQENSLKCESCGTRVGRICPNCKTHNVVTAHKCKNCGCEFVPTYKQALWAMHMGTTRHLKCPKCNKRTWCKKVLKK